jgi:hypothetical protein
MLGLLVSLVLLAGTAVASEGVNEISQAGVTAAGGFPFVITTSGSYVLTSNLTVPDANTTAVDVQVDGVTVDLNGFTIRGPVVCTGDALTATTCSIFGLGNGIQSTAANVTVRNGIIRGLGNNGIDLTGDGTRVETVIAVSNGQRGISVGPTAMVEGCMAIRNGTNGFGLGRNSAITQSVAVTNGSTGIVTSFGAEVSRNSSIFNGGGISASRGSVIADNAVSRNRGTGIFCTAGCLVNGNNIRGNGNVGLSLQSQSGYTNNVIVDHDVRPVQGGVYLSPNVCDNSVASSVCDPP